MTMLVTGASGLLGAHLMAGLAPHERMVGVDRHAWWGDRAAEVVLGELSDAAFVESVMDMTKPTVVLHCAAMVDVDACERNPGEAFERNAEVTRLVARATPPGTLLVYVTTDGIFSGERPFMDEDEVPAPRTVYGRSKLQGETEVCSATPNHLIIRTNFFGWSSGRKPSSSEWLYDALARGARITAFDDFFFTPIYVCDLVDRLRGLIQSNQRGVFNLCSRERVSKYEFALRMAELASLPASAVSRGSIDDAGLLAPRPKDMSLSCSRAERVLGEPMPDCDEGLKRFLAHRAVPLSQRFMSGTSFAK